MSVNRRQTLVICLLLFQSVAGFAMPSCAGDVLGTSRTLLLKRESASYGAVQYASLPLARDEVIITFDDGPRKESTPRILEALQEQCVLATFFMNGAPLAKNIALGRQVLSAGHSVAMHAYEHEHFRKLPAAAQLSDLKAMQDVFRRAFNAEAAAYRFPFLEETDPLKDSLRAQGITIMSVDAGIDDWLPDQSPEVLAARLVERLTSSGGGILFIHDSQDQTARALPLLLRTLKNHHFKVVHLDWNPL